MVLSEVLLKKIKEANKEAIEYANKFRNKLIWSILFVPVLLIFWPDLLPFGYFSFWGMKGNLWDWLRAGLPVFAWGSTITAFQVFTTRNDFKVNRFAEKILAGGTGISIEAGVLEELTYRWLFVLGNIVSLKILNFILFGFTGMGMLEFFQTYFFGPVVDSLTLGYLKPYIFHPSGWAVGAAIIWANIFFRNGHKYLGWFGFINSWFIGMFLFWMVFTYGLLSAIIVHFLYDFLIFFIHYIDAAIERERGFV